MSNLEKFSFLLAIRAIVGLKDSSREMCVVVILNYNISAKGPVLKNNLKLYEPVND